MSLDLPAVRVELLPLDVLPEVEALPDRAVAALLVVVAGVVETGPAWSGAGAVEIGTAWLGAGAVETGTARSGAGAVETGTAWSGAVAVEIGAAWLGAEALEIGAAAPGAVEAVGLGAGLGPAATG